jgi:general secretion pathway protein H
LRRSAERGFTLVELMVVLVIVGLMSAAVVLAIPEPGGGLRAEALRFAARAQAARELAVTDNKTIAVRLDAGGYAFQSRRGGKWEAIDAKPLGGARWQEGTVATMEGQSRSIVFDPTGFAEPARVRLGRGAQSAVVEIGEGGEVHVAS